MASDNAISARRVNFAYGADQVVRDVSLALDTGTALALTGPNGSGKTTLLRLLAGSLRPASGAVAVMGRSMETLSARERASVVAVVSQHVDPGLTLPVEAVVALGRTPYSGLMGTLNARDRAAIAHAMEATDTLAFISRTFSELSGGEQQRVMLATALAQEPRFLLLDEPTVHLDLEHQYALLELLADLRRERHIGVLAVMHDLNLSALYFDRIAVLKDGSLAADGTPGDVLNRQDLESLFSAPLRRVTHPDAGVPQVFLRPS